MNTLETTHQKLQIRAILLAERINVRAIELANQLATAPLVLGFGSEGFAVIFRYGAVVLFNTTGDQDTSLLKMLEPHATGLFEDPATETAEYAVAPGQPDHVETDGTILLRDAGLERLQVVADVLGKSVALDHYETDLAGTFDRIEPLATELQRGGRIGSHSRDLLRHIGDVLSVQHKMVGRVQVMEKPELLWENPLLERLYARMDDEYELRERHNALEAKLALISRTVETVLNLSQNRRSLRVEWYIVILILVEIILYVYELIRHPA